MIRLLERFGNAVVGVLYATYMVPMIWLMRRLPGPLQPVVPLSVIALCLGGSMFSLFYMGETVVGGPGTRTLVTSDVALLRDGPLGSCILASGAAVEQVSHEGERVSVRAIGPTGGARPGDCAPGDVGAITRREWAGWRLADSRRAPAVSGG